MALMDWSPALSVGIAEIDEQHKKLVGMVNQLNDGMAAGKSKEALQKILTGLIEYTASHFGTEEKLFAQHGYPETVLHTGEHKKLVEKVLAFDKDYKAGKMMLSMEVMNFLKDWLVKHIQGTDKKYTSFFNAKGVR